MESLHQLAIHGGERWPFGNESEVLIVHIQGAGCNTQGKGALAGH